LRIKERETHLILPEHDDDDDDDDDDVIYSHEAFRVPQTLIGKAVPVLSGLLDSFKVYQGCIHSHYFVRGVTPCSLVDRSLRKTLSLYRII
jgi:hypothetical protein